MSERDLSRDEAIDAAPLVTSEDLDLEILEDLDRHLRVPVNYYRVDEEGELNEFVLTDWRRFPIRSQLPIPTMSSLLRLEARINEAIAADDDDEADAQLQKALTDSYRRIVSIIVERTPRAFEIVEMDVAGVEGPVKVKPQIELDTTQILASLAWISGDNSVADAVAKTITAGRSAARTKTQVEQGEDDPSGGGSGEVEPDVPFPLSAH